MYTQKFLKEIGTKPEAFGDNDWPLYFYTHTQVHKCMHIQEKISVHINWFEHVSVMWRQYKMLNCAPISKSHFETSKIQ